MVGYTFIGWSSDTDWTNTSSSVALFANEASFVSNITNNSNYTYNHYEILKSQILAGNVNLYVRWQAETYTIRFNVNDITGTTPVKYFSGSVYDRNNQFYDVTVEFDSNDWINLDVTLVSRYGYTWLGWFMASGDSTLVLAGTDRTAKVNPASQPKFDYNLYQTLVSEKSLAPDCGTLDEKHLNVTDNDHIVQLYAHWKANTYNLYYYTAVATFDDENLVNGILGIKWNYELYMVVTVTYDGRFIVETEVVNEDFIPEHYDYYTWFRWYNNYDNLTESNDPNPDYLGYNAIDWFENYDGSKWYDPNVSNDTFKLNESGDSSHLDHINIDEASDTLADEQIINSDLISSDKFIYAGTSLYKYFAGDEYYFGYFVKEIYYADFYDTNKNPETNFDENGVDKGHFFVTPTEENVNLDKNYVYLETNENKSNLGMAKYANDFSWSWDPFAVKRQEDYAFNEYLNVPSWYKFIGWYVQIDQERIYIINDEFYSNSYFDKTDAQGNKYHEYVYTYTGIDGTQKTAISKFYYTTDDNGEITFIFTHAYTNIDVYAVYEMVEYTVEFDINADYGATDYFGGVVDNINSDSITHGNKVNFMGSYDLNSKFPEYVGSNNLIDYTPNVFTQSETLFYNGFTYNTDVTIYPTVIQNNDIILYILFIIILQ